MFSSHTIFALAGMMTYNEYGTHLATKVWSCGLLTSCSTLWCTVTCMGWPAIPSDWL